MEESPLTHVQTQQACQQPAITSLDAKAGESFFKQGELRLLHGDASGIQFFDLALQLDPHNAKLHYDQGLALCEFGHEKGKEKILLLAIKRFKAATTLDPHYFDAYLAWGNALARLGENTQEFHYFLTAEAQYKKALLISDKQPQDVLADLYWSYGSVWNILAKRSKEPSDLHAALEAFRKAREYQDDLPIEFWHDYGYINLALGFSINDLRYVMQGIHCFKNAVSIAISSFESWHHLAQALAKLYTYTHDEDHFLQANECYTTAAQLNSQNSTLWLNWARLLNESGQLIKDAKRMRSSLEKIMKAQTLDKKNITVSCIYTEALATLGFLKEDVEPIHEAHNRLLQIGKKEAPSIELSYSLGYTLLCLGKYFNDLDYFYQAAEQFQEGLSLDRTSHKLWHALGLSYTHAALIEEDPNVFEKAHRFYLKALALQGLSSYYFDYGFSLLKYAEYYHHEKLFELASNQFELALSLQKNSMYLHPEWLFYYGITLDHLAGFHDDVALYTKSLEVLNHVLMIDPEHPQIHYNLALIYSHFAEASAEPLPYQQAFYHYKLAYKRNEEQDSIILDWAITLASYADHLQDFQESLPFFREAEFKMTQAAKLGNIHAYYHLACLYSLLNQLDKAMLFMKKAEDFDALPIVQELLEDDWLENLRKTSHFQNFLSQLEERNPVQDS